MAGYGVTFLQEDLSVTILKQLGAVKDDTGLEFPKFDYVFALASVVDGRSKIDGDPVGVAVHLAIDSLFFLWQCNSRHGDLTLLKGALGSRLSR